MDFQDIVNIRRGLSINNMNSRRQYGTSANNYCMPPKSCYKQDQDSNILKRVPIDTVLTNYDIFGNTTPIISDKTFKSYENTNCVSKDKKVPESMLGPISSVSRSINPKDPNMLEVLSEAFTTGVKNMLTKLPIHLDNLYSSTSDSISCQDVVDCASISKQQNTITLPKQMKTSISMDGSKSNDAKMYCMLESCQSTSGQSNTADINRKTEKYSQSDSDACHVSSFHLQNVCLDFPIDRDDCGLKIVCGCNTSDKNKSQNSQMLCAQADKSNGTLTISNNTMDSTRRWHSIVPPPAFDNPKLTQLQFKYQSDYSDNKPPEKKSTVGSKFLQQVRDRKAEASQNEMRNKKALDTGNSVTSCEDKIARLKELLSKKQQSYDVDELKQVPRNVKPKENSPCEKSENVLTAVTHLPSELQNNSQKMVDTSTTNNQQSSDPVDSLNDISNCFCEGRSLIPSVGIEDKIEELEVLMDKLTLNESKCLENTKEILEMVSTKDYSSNEKITETMASNNNNGHLPSVVSDDNNSCISSIDQFENPKVPKSLESHSFENTDSNQPTYCSSVAIEQSQHTHPSNCEVICVKQETPFIKKMENKVPVEEPLSVEKVTSLVETRSSPGLDANMDLVPNTNNIVKASTSNAVKKNKRHQMKKNHRLSAVKINETNVQSGECGNENSCALQERLSPVKERHMPHNKVCSKKHKNEHCIKKHRHKAKENFKRDIRDDIACDSSTEHSEPVYFSTDSLKFHQDVKKVNKKPIASKKAVSEKKDSVESGSKCRLSESVEKCVNFISTQISPLYNNVCNGKYKERLSSTESEDCLGFDEIKGKFKQNNSECESDDSFVVVFSDSSSPCEKAKERVRLPSECDSEDSFVICFEGGEETPDGCYGNDEVYSDSDVGSDSDSETESDEEVHSEMSSDECETIMEQPPRLKSCLKRRTSPKPESVQEEKKVSFSTNKPVIHKMIVWAHAYRQARIGLWERYGRDAERFKQRIQDTSVCLEWVFKREHRNRIFFQRFRPLLMRALREEREAKAREAKRLKEEEEKQLKDEEEAKQLIEEEERQMKEKEEKCGNEMEEECERLIQGDDGIREIKSDSINTIQIEELSTDCDNNSALSVMLPSSNLTPPVIETPY